MVKEKEQFEEKRYAIISKELIKSYGESAGHADISDEVAALLAEDVVYRLREATQKSCQFMRHAKRKRLTTEDFNKAARVSDIAPFVGYSSPEPVSFRYVKEGELHFVEDHDINLGNVAFSSQVPSNPGETMLQAHWLTIEGVSKNASGPKVAPVKQTEKLTCNKLPNELQNYWNNMIEAILGNDDVLTKCALADLKSNPRIQPILPHFVNFISIGVKTVSHDITQLSKLLQTVKAIVINQFIYLELQPYLDLLIQAVLYCLLEPLAASMLSSNDHWVLRDNAAQLLNHISRIWSDSMNQLQSNIVKSLKDVLVDHTKPFCSHYGAVVGLTAFGSMIIEEYLLPHMEYYWKHLNKTMEEEICRPHKVDAFKVCGAVHLAAEIALMDKRKKVLNVLCSSTENYSNSTIGSFIKCEKNESNDTYENGCPQQTPLTEVNDDIKNHSFTMCNTLNNLYQEISSYFGDTFSGKFPVLNITNFYSKPLKDNFVSLSDEFTGKTGEEMLDNFLASTFSADIKLLNVDLGSEPSSQTLTEESYEEEHTRNLKSLENNYPPIKKVRVEKKTVDTMAKKITKCNSISSIFDQKHRLSPLFIFNYAGCIQESKPTRKPFTLNSDAVRYHSSELYQLSHKLKKVGVKTLSKSINSRKKFISVHLSSLSIVI